MENLVVEYLIFSKFCSVILCSNTLKVLMAKWEKLLANFPLSLHTGILEIFSSPKKYFGVTEMASFLKTLDMPDTTIQIIRQFFDQGDSLCFEGRQKLYMLIIKILDSIDVHKNLWIFTELFWLVGLYSLDPEPLLNAGKLYLLGNDSESLMLLTKLEILKEHFAGFKFVPFEDPEYRNDPTKRLSLKF